MTPIPDISELHVQLIGGAYFYCLLDRSGRLAYLSKAFRTHAGAWREGCRHFRLCP